MHTSYLLWVFEKKDPCPRHDTRAFPITMPVEHSCFSCSKSFTTLTLGSKNARCEPLCLRFMRAIIPVFDGLGFCSFCYFSLATIRLTDFLIAYELCKAWRWLFFFWHRPYMDATTVMTGSTTLARLMTIPIAMGASANSSSTWWLWISTFFIHW